ncbi:hypothetical protein ACFL0M_10075 [Thermodesulfobacteriota bacterium]
METSTHKCPECGETMVKIEMPTEKYIPVDFGSTGPSGVTVASSLDLENYRTPRASITRAYGSMFDSEIVKLIPYECSNPNCGHLKSFPI